MPCPYLNTRSHDGTYYAYPSRGNACHAQPSVKRQGLLKQHRPWVSVPRSRQEELCLEDRLYPQCPLFKHAADKIP